MKTKIKAVDDNPVIRKLLQGVAKIVDYDLCVKDFTECSFEELLLSDANLLLLDINLNEVSGIDLCIKLKSEGFSKPIVIMSSFSSKHESEEVKKQSGCEAYIHKPVTPDNLKRIVESLL